MLSRRALPERDTTIDALSADERSFAAKRWLGRARGELESTRGFTWIADACTELGDDREFIALARRAVADEERHGEICRRVAAAYAGSDVIPHVSAPAAIDLRTPDDFELAVTLYILESCCLSETIGAVMIEAALATTTAQLATTALRELLTDEVMHARMGWAYLGAPALGGRHRAAIAEWLPVMLDTMFEYWTPPPSRPTPPVLLAHGCVPAERVDELVLVAFEDLVLPGFEHAGVDIRAGAAYLARRRATSPGPTD